MPRKDSKSQTRTRGKDKARDRYARNGKCSSKHLRNIEKIREAREKQPVKK
jgi:hypothetical protein